MTCNYWSWCVCACMFVCFCLFFYFSLFLLNYHFVKIHCTHFSTIEFSFCLTNPKIELILSHLAKNFNLFGSYCNNLLLILSIAEYLLKKIQAHMSRTIFTKSSISYFQIKLCFDCRIDGVYDNCSLLD